MNDCGQGIGCQIADTAGWLAAPLLESVGSAAERVSDHFPMFWPLVAGATGGVLASLFGMVLDRLPRIHGWHGKPEKGLTLYSPGSHCENCGAPVPGYALIPVIGWFLAKGQCEPCGSRVPAIYPAVEAAVAFLSMALATEFGPTFSAVTACLLLWTLTFVAWLDWKEKVIPDGITVPLAFAGLLLSPFEPDPWARIAGAAVAGGCVWVAFRLTTALKNEDAMAYGDVALACACGAWIGFCSAPAFLLASTVAYMAYAAPLRMRKGEIWVPMGPAIAAGALAIVASGIRIQI